MNDDLVVAKILKLLENNTAFIGYALNGGIGTKINVRNTETGKTIQALSVNVDSTGEVLVVKDSEDNQYKAVTFKIAEKVSERIIQIRKTKPIDDKKTIEYTDSDIEVFYLFVKLIDTGSPVTSQLTSTWIRKGSSCTQFVGAYERCNYGARQTISGTSYTGLPYVPYSTLTDCLNDDLGRDAKTPHGSKDESGGNAGWRYYSTQVSAANEASMLAALTSHDANSGTNMRKLFGYGSIIECSGAMNLQGWEVVYNSQTGQNYIHCEFSYFPGYTTDCTPAMQAAGYCDTRGFISSKCPQYGQQAPGQPGIGNIDSSWNALYGWKDLPYEFMYKRHFGQLYLNGSTAPGSFYILEVNEDQVPSQLPSGYFPWTPGCPGNAPNGGPYDGSGGNRFPDGVAPISKRDMKLSTHKAEIWLGSSKRTEAIKLYELGASDLFSGMYNPFIIKANETLVDTYNRTNTSIPTSNTVLYNLQHEKFYENRNKNRIDLLIDPRVWVYIIDNKPEASFQGNFDEHINPTPQDLQTYIDNLYNRTINLTVVDNKTQIVHLKLGLTPRSNLSNTDCKGANSGLSKGGDAFSSQSWEYQKNVTVKVSNWAIQSITNTLDTTELENSDIWNTDHIKRKYVTSFGAFNAFLNREHPTKLLLRPNANIGFSELISGNHFEQYNYNQKRIGGYGYASRDFYIDDVAIQKDIASTDIYRRVGVATTSWWELWNKTHYNKKNKRLSSIVGFDRNFYQILRSSGLGLGLNYAGYTSGAMTAINAVIPEDYYEYLPSRPLNYIPSLIRGTRDKLYPENYFPHVNRTYLLNQTGMLFYFGEWDTRWTEIYPFTGMNFITPPDNYYAVGYSGAIMASKSFTQFSNNVDKYNYGKRVETRRWINSLWAQLIYDSFVRVDVDSYKNVEFSLPTNPAQYIKYSHYYEYTNSSYPFTTQTAPNTFTEIKTVLTPGQLDINKQVPIEKPTNVELDPNMSFLVYMYPFCTVTKKTKEI